MSKKALKGFAGLKMGLVSKNDSTGYTPGELFPVPGAQSMTREPQTTDWKIEADDGVYDSGTDWNGDNVTITVAELPLSLRSQLDGATYNQATGVYTFKSIDIAPELCLTFKALQADNNYRMYRFYSFKVKTITEEWSTKAQGKTLTSVTIEGTFNERIFDHSVFSAKDSTAASDLDWLDEVDSLDGTTDTTAPTLVSLTPDDEATEVARSSAIVAEFSEALSPSSVTAQTFIVLKGATAVQGTISSSPDNKTFTFTPTSQLDLDTSYVVMLTNGIKDIAGNALEQTLFSSFTTADA